MKRFRVDSHWNVTVIETNNDDPEGLIRQHDNDRLIATAQTPEDALAIAYALNLREEQGRRLMHEFEG